MNIERHGLTYIIIAVLAVVAAVSLGWVIVQQTGGTLKSERNYETWCDQSGFRLFFATGLDRKSVV